MPENQNQILKNAVLACMICHTNTDLNMYANRNDIGHVTGYILACPSCALAVKNAKLILHQTDKIN